MLGLVFESGTVTQGVDSVFVVLVPLVVVVVVVVVQDWIVISEALMNLVFPVLATFTFTAFVELPKAAKRAPSRVALPMA